MRIQHNIMAMNAYRNYNTNTSALAKNLEKLSSGYKINRAGDDAAGLAISEKMRAQITGLNAAQKNVKDGISLVKTAEGAMQEIQDMLNRMDYLATQSANGTYDDPVDRLNLQKEVDALKTEINRIADSANFNGIQLLDGSQSSSGSSSSVDLKIDDAACGLGQLHSVGVKEQEAEFKVDLRQALNNVTAKASIGANGTFEVTMKVGGKDIAFTVTNGSTSVAEGGTISSAEVANLTVALKTAGAVELEDANGNKMEFDITIEDNAVVKFKLKAGDPKTDFTVAQDVTLEADGTKIEWKDGTAGTKTTYNCNTQATKNGYAAQNDQLAHGEFEFTKSMANSLANGGKLVLGSAEYGTQTTITFDKDQDNTGTANGVVGVKDLLDSSGNIKTDKATLAELVSRIALTAAGDSTFTVGAGNSDTTISLTEKFDYYDSSSDPKEKIIDSKAKFQALVNFSGGATAGAAGLTLQIGDTADSFNRLTVSIGDMHTAALKSATAGNSIAEIDISSRDGAQAAIQTIRDAINYVSGVRGDLGATQNRLEHTQKNLSVMAENIQDAESTIRDTDVAEEMMAYTKNNILVQSAQAMLAQANAVPQGVLQLLG